jgi:glutamine amidotransferase PdxT
MILHDCDYDCDSICVLSCPATCNSTLSMKEDGFPGEGGGPGLMILSNHEHEQKIFMMIQVQRRAFGRHEQPADFHPSCATSSNFQQSMTGEHRRMSCVELPASPLGDGATE